MKQFNKFFLAVIIPLFLFVSFPQKSSAQSYIRLNYDISLPAGVTSDFISKASFRGGSFGFGHYISDHFSLGLKIGLHTFYEALGKEIYTEDNVSFYGNQTKYINSFPALVDLQFNFAGYNNITPYVGLAGGAYYFQKKTEIGLYSITNDNTWNLGFQPAAGFLFNIDENASINISAKYNYIHKNSSVDHQGYVNITLGLMLYDVGSRQ